MLNFVTGSIFDSEHQCLVNPVNCVGVMGKGLALEFKRRYPGMFAFYSNLCEEAELNPRAVKFWPMPYDAPRYVCLFPTKLHWRQPSLMEYIDDGLTNFVKEADRMQLESVAFPMIGCGLGGLNFEHEVLPMFVKHLSASPMHVDIYVT